MSNNGDKLNIKNLLENYSLEEISSLFSNIDEKIIELHKYSSEDFLNLNKDFQAYHKITSKISDNATCLFDILSKHESTILPSGINKLIETLNDKNSQLKDKVATTSNVINELLSRVRQAFFPIKNFKQNLTSLRFLESNLELEHLDNEGIEPYVIGDIAEKTKEELVNIEKSFQKIKQRIKNEMLNEQKFYTDDLNIADILTDLEEELGIYRSHFEKAGNHLPEIKNRTEQTKEGISKIITNLQYHDIIKQKMQHIQNTHKDLVSELSKIHDEDDSSDLGTKAKYFLRIRDIAGLQAAQLMQTNKEYQTAIQRISGKFLEIGENMSFVAKQCNSYIALDAEKQKVFFNTFKTNLENAKTRIEKFCEFNAKFVDNIQSISNNFDKVVEHNKNIGLLLEDIKKFIELKKENYQNTENEEGIINQLDQMYNDLGVNYNNLASLIDDIHSYGDKLKHTLVDVNGNDQPGNIHEYLPGKIDDYINELEKVENLIIEKLTENNDLSEDILVKIQKTVNNIKYYDYFEKIIEKIINDLNTINYRLKFDGDSVQDKEENLKKLTEYYTMNSEFLIHQQVASGDEQELDVSEDGGDLELF
ncbi:MAG: hypothetical protein ACLFT4_04060 [Bacteroidales bacterium]